MLGFRVLVSLHGAFLHCIPFFQSDITIGARFFWSEILCSSAFLWLLQSLYRGKPQP